MWRNISKNSKPFLALVVILSLALLNRNNESMQGESTHGLAALRRLLHDSNEESVKATRTHHKPLFPMDSGDIWGTLFVGLGSMIAASGGIGGGGILVPILILVFGFHPKYAIPLSNFTIVGSSITNMVMNLPKRHPNVDRPLVDWDLILVMEPLTMVGAVLGAFLAKILPDQVLSVSLVVLLAFTTKTTLEKGISLWNKETETFECESRGAVAVELELNVKTNQEKSLLSDDDDELSDDEGHNQRASLGITVDVVTTDSSTHLPIIVNKSQEVAKGDEKQNLGNAYPPVMTPEERLLNEIGTQFDTEVAHAGNLRLQAQARDAELRALLQAEAETPQLKLRVMSGMVAAVIFLNLIKGGRSDVFPSPLGIDCGSYAYWFLQISVLILVLCVSYWARENLVASWRTKNRLGYRYAAGDVEWNETNTLKYPFYCFFAGLCAGMFGVGGGIVKGPLMLYMGVHPLVASATVAVMIMFTSIAATAMFMAFGVLQWDYAWFLFFVGLITTAIGQFGVSYLVQKYRRVSLVSLSIGAVVALSTLLMALQSMFALTEADVQPAEDNSVCG